MRVLLAILSLLLVVNPAIAQTALTENVGIVPNTVYNPPPHSVELPRTWDMETVRANRGNLTAWRDRERQRLGAFEFDARTGAARNALPEIGGYFAFFGDGELPGGVVEARWFRSASAVAEASPIWSRYMGNRQLCGGRLESSYADLSEMTYLGSNWLTKFETLDRELAAASPAATGQNLPEGVTLSFAQGVSLRDFSRYYPQRAFRENTPGYAELSCLVRSNFGLYCATLSDEPAGFGFGEAAQRVMRSVLAAPTLSDGAPSAGHCLRRRITFAMP